jgi:hypothetical protein
MRPFGERTATSTTSPRTTFTDLHGYTLSVRIPASKVIGCSFTGLGCLGEQEFVVAGGSGQQVMAVANSTVRYHHAIGNS